jgi:hypothetical protein
MVKKRASSATRKALKTKGGFTPAFKPTLKNLETFARGYAKAQMKGSGKVAKGLAAADAIGAATKQIRSGTATILDMARRQEESGLQLLLSRQWKYKANRRK